MIKKITLLFLFAIAFSWQGNAQVSIGMANDGSTYNSAPIAPYYGYSYSQIIYLSSQISASGTITALEFQLNPGTVLTNSDDTVDVWIGHTTKTSFASTTDWVDISTLTASFSRSMQ